jgi:hypothetical protein
MHKCGNKKLFIFLLLILNKIFNPIFIVIIFKYVFKHHFIILLLQNRIHDLIQYFFLHKGLRVIIHQIF